MFKLNFLIVFMILFFAKTINNYSLAQTTTTKLNLLIAITLAYKTDVLQKLANKESDSLPSLGSILVWRKNSEVDLIPI